MGYNFTEDKFFEMESQAINSPREFISSLPHTKNNMQLPRVVISLNLVTAYLALGQYKKAQETLDQIKPELDKSMNHFCLCRYNLLQYQISSYSDTGKERAGKALEAAEKHWQLHRVPSLACMVLVAKCLSGMSDREITQSEDMLQEAMQAASECNYIELMLDVYIAYIQIYHMHNLPDMANRELMLIQEFIDQSRSPNKYAQMLNQQGVILMVVKQYQQAKAALEQAIEIAQAKGYTALLTQIYINLGIGLTRYGDILTGIAMYDKSIALMINEESLHPKLMAKVMCNKANALASCGELEQSKQLHYHLIEKAIAVGNEQDRYILHVNLADVLIEMKEYEKAEALITEAIKFFSTSKQYNFLQNCYLCEARLNEAKEDYQSAFNSMEELDQVSSRYFNDNFNKQAKKYSKRIEELRNEFLKMKHRCHDLELVSSSSFHPEMVGEHPAIKKALVDSLLAAQHPFVNVLISGESGTGKEIIARIIHNTSQEKKPLVALNTSAITQTLIESELFGHVKGAFTGATNEQKGKFLLANNGTLFLDEISEMPIECQAKLLRAIENQSITPVGSDKEITVRCRIICATNSKMSDLIRENKFRLDLYHRINKVEIYLPPLRERLSDLELLCEHFVKRFSKELGLPLPKLSEEFYDCLRRYSFPGNVRELMNIIERIFILKPQAVWTATLVEGLIPSCTPHKSSDVSFTVHINQQQSDIIINALDQCGWIQKDAARLLKMTESTLCRRIKKLGIQKM